MNPPPTAAAPTSEETAAFIELLHKKYQPVMHWAGKLESAGVTVSVCSGILIFILIVAALVTMANVRNTGGPVVVYLCLITIAITIGSLGTALQARARHYRGNVTGHITNCPHLSLGQVTELLLRLSPRPEGLTSSPPKSRKSFFKDA